MTVVDKIKEIFFEKRERAERELYVTDVTKCLKKAYYSILKPTQATPSMIIGRLLHMALETLIERHINAFFEVSFALSLGNGWVLKGRCDMLMDNEVYELKFVRNIENAKENASYYLQLQLYLYAFRAKKGYLVFINRDTLDIEAVEVEPDAYVAKKLIEDAEYLAECIEKRTVPDRLSPRFADECEYCDYSDICSL